MISALLSSLYKEPILQVATPIFVDNTLRVTVPFLMSILLSRISNETMAIIVVANVLILAAFSLLECFSQASITIISQ